MARGGKRIGSGNKSKWNSGKTKVIRVPELIADQVLTLAKELDDNGFIDSVTYSKTIDLSGVSIANFNGKTCVFLQDLVLSGYDVKPKILAEKIVSEIYKKQLSQGNLNNEWKN